MTPAIAAAVLVIALIWWGLRELDQAGKATEVLSHASAPAEIAAEDNKEPSDATLAPKVSDWTTEPPGRLGLHARLNYDMALSNEFIEFYRLTPAETAAFAHLLVRTTRGIREAEAERFTTTTRNGLPLIFVPRSNDSAERKQRFFEEASSILGRDRAAHVVEDSKPVFDTMWGDFGSKDRVIRVAPAPPAAQAGEPDQLWTISILSTILDDAPSDVENVPDFGYLSEGRDGSTLQTLIVKRVPPLLGHLIDDRPISGN